MKRNLMFALLAGIILVAVYSFAIVKPNHKTHPPKAKVKPAKTFTCNTSVGTVTGVYNSPWSVTITWTHTGAVDHYTYGGNFFCPSGGPGYGTTTTTSSSATITIPYSSDCPNGYSGLNGRIIPYCNDGTPGTDKVFSITH